MTIEEFADLLVEEVKKDPTFANYEYEISDNAVGVNGSGHRLAIKFATVTLSAGIDTVYEAFENGKPIKEIASEFRHGIKKLRNEHVVGKSYDFVNNWDQVKTMIYPRVVNTTRNQTALNDYVHTDLPDTEMSVMYGIQLTPESSVPISNDLMGVWGIQEKLLRSTALINMYNDQYEIFNIEEIMVSVTFGMQTKGLSFDDIKKNGNKATYIVKSKKNIFGACVCINQLFLKNMHDAVGDFYLLPCSVHEMIIVPVHPDLEVPSLIHTIAEGNKCLSPKEYLGDKPLIWNGIELKLAS